MCGGGSNAADEANQQEAARQARIKQNITGIDNAYSSPARATQIQDFLNATRTNYTQDLNKQKTQADLNTKFALARSGIAGGSADVDQNQALSQQYQTGLIDADRKAQSAAAGLQSSDEAARQNLISLATSGADVTNPGARAAQSFSNNLSTANQNAASSGLDDLFSQFSKLYTTSQTAAANRDAAKFQYGTLYGSPVTSTSQNIYSH